MTVKIEDRNKNNIKRKFNDTFTEDDKISKEISPKLKRKKVKLMLLNKMIDYVFSFNECVLPT